jgi:hypothetical protein
LRNFIHTLKRIFSDKGLLLTLALSLILLFIFYGKLLIHPCHTYFGYKGDGMQIYYETLYHIKFDPEYWRQKSINYPYGESIFFTGAMPFVNNLVKIFGPSAAPWGVGLINLMMLFSPVVGALFLYAIFKHLRLPWHYSAVCASAIAFLSPQLARFNGHYSLSWVFLIPAILYLLLRFYDFPSVKKSFLIAFVVFLGATTHIYFLAFFLAIGAVYWGTLYFTIDRGFGRISYVLKHTGIQFLLPVALFEILVKMSDHVTDRTTAPWGYLVFHSNNSGVFFPFNRPYEKFFEMLWKHADVGYEGVAFVGLAAIIGLITIFGIQCYRLIRLRFKLILSVTDHKVLNIFFWTSVFLLWISFAWPFLGGNEEWLLKIGPLQQFRAIGRFAWVFFYVANIVVVYRLYKISQRKKFILYTTLFLIPGILLFDMYYNARRWQDSLNNKVVELDDENNSLPQDAWMKNFNPSVYQAILPLPYFHVGSENLARDPHDKEIINCTYIVSLKTGLPMMSVLAARTSIGQSLKMLPLILDPLRPIPVLKDLPDNRPLLLVVRPDSLDENEKRILSIAKPIATSDKYSLFSVLPSEIAGIAIHQYDSVKTDFAAARKFQTGEFISTDSAAVYVHCDYDTMKGPAYRGWGGYTGSMRNYNALYDGVISKPGEYIGSFWANNADKDVYPRTAVEVYAYDPNNEKNSSYYLFSDKLSPIKAIEGSWALIEFPITIPCENAHLKITCWNYAMKKENNFEADELLIRPAGTDLYKIKGDTIYRNNRIYFPQK